MKITESTTVRDIVVAFPQTRRVLEGRGVDYCCNGHMELKIAAERAGINIESLLADLTAALENNPAFTEERNWSAASASELSKHILETHHAFLRRQLPRIRGLLQKVSEVHRSHAATLEGLSRVFAGLQQEIENHLMKEEMILFPYIQQLEGMAAGREPFVPMHCGSVASPIRQMEHEHDSAGAALVELRALSSNYTPPSGTCPTFAELYQSLQALEADLHEHIHLENNILFPRAVEMERQLVTESR